MKYVSTKTYGSERGLSTCFRQWRATSHCQLMHGYSLGFRFEFESDSLDEKFWVVDFGSLKTVKAKLDNWFDHTVLVATDDPLKDTILNLEKLGLGRVIEVDATGCEAISKMVYDWVAYTWLPETGYYPRVTLRKVEVMEHGSNSAYYGK